MSFIVQICDLIEPETGKSYRELNLEEAHSIPLGALVEVKYDTWYGEGACEKVHARLWVVKHTRDCDETPLYSLSRWNDYEFAKSVLALKHGFAEEDLTVVEITQDLLEGYGGLGWENES